MEWATQFHGFEGKVHADKRTAEYGGRGNHGADAVSFVGAISVGKWLAARAQLVEASRRQRMVCLESPLVSIQGVSSDRGADKRVEDDEAVAEVPFRGETKLQKPRNGKKRAGNTTARRKKRRVEEEETQTDSAVLRLPVYYYEVQVLATRHFQGASGSVRDTSVWGQVLQNASDDGGDDEGEDEEENGEDCEMKDGEEHEEDDDESDEVAMEVDLMAQPLGDEARAPWRGRARRLIHDHLRATALGFAPSADDHGRDGAASRITVTNNGNGVNGGDELSNNGDGGDSQHPRPLTNGNGNGTGNSSGRLLRSTSSSTSSLPQHSAQQQLLLSFPLSSSTIQQIRLRLERQQQQTHVHRSRFASAASSDSGSVSLSSAISSIHARQRRETVRRKRSNHHISVGFMFAKDGCGDLRDVCHDELGRHACSVAFVGKTGAVMSSGQTFLQTDVRFGYGDTVGCGVILDTRTFFWTVNGRVAATIAANDIHHLDDFEDHDMIDDNDAEWFASWAEQLLPAVSLHEHGECVRALFTPSSIENFRFDVEAFKQQQLKERQKSLSSYATTSTLPKAHGNERDEETIMHRLVEDYFAHFGYGNALAALHGLHRGDHEGESPATTVSDSIAFRHAVRQLIYAFKTQDALRKLETKWQGDAQPESKMLLHCHILCVVDVLYAGNTARRKGGAAEAVVIAQELLQDYLTATDIESTLLQDVRAFMSVLLYPSVNEVPVHSPGRRFFLWQFREEVADAVNEALAGNGDQPCALETLVDDLSELQRESLSCGATAFPPTGGSLQAAGFTGGRTSRYERTKRRHSIHRSSEDADSDQDDVHGSDSSSSSESEGDDDDDDDDDEEENE